MLLSYDELLSDVVGAGVLTGLPDLSYVNGSSIDITLGATLLVEAPPRVICPRCGQPPFSDSAARGIPRDREGLGQYVRCANPECGYGGPLHTFIKPVDFSQKEPLAMNERQCDLPEGFTLHPGEVCLAHSEQVFNLPYNMTAEYRLKSSMGRVFLEHLHAGWCDPGWHGSVLTLEFKNVSQYHSLVLRAGMKCGQVCFYRHTEVPEDKSYAVRGRYNQDTTATASKGMR
jgi:deoxycytidine triphosphate deaminase